MLRVSMQIFISTENVNIVVPLSSWLCGVRDGPDYPGIRTAEGKLLSLGKMQTILIVELLKAKILLYPTVYYDDDTL